MAELERLCSVGRFAGCSAEVPGLRGRLSCGMDWGGSGKSDCRPPAGRLNRRVSVLFGVAGLAMACYSALWALKRSSICACLTRSTGRYFGCFAEIAAASAASKDRIDCLGAHAVMRIRFRMAHAVL